jgi:hypothetical protein
MRSPNSRHSPFAPLNEEDKPLSPFSRRPLNTLQKEPNDTEAIRPSSTFATGNLRVDLYNPQKRPEEKRVPTPLPMSSRSPHKGSVTQRPPTPVHVQRSLLQRTPPRRSIPFPPSPSVNRPSLLGSKATIPARRPAVPDGI